MPHRGLLKNAIKDIRFAFPAIHGEIIFQLHASDIRQRPDRNLAVTVFTDDERMHAAGIHPGVLTEQVSEPGGIQDGTGADHPVGRQA